MGYFLLLESKKGTGINDLPNLFTFKVMDMKESDDDYRFLVESTTLPPLIFMKLNQSTKPVNVFKYFEDLIKSIRVRRDV